MKPARKRVGQVPRKRLSPELKASAVEMWKSAPLTIGQISSTLGIPKSTLALILKNAGGKDPFPQRFRTVRELAVATEIAFAMERGEWEHLNKSELARNYGFVQSAGIYKIARYLEKNPEFKEMLLARNNWRKVELSPEAKKLLKELGTRERKPLQSAGNPPQNTKRKPKKSETDIAVDRALHMLGHAGPKIRMSNSKVGRVAVKLPPGAIDAAFNAVSAELKKLGASPQNLSPALRRHLALVARKAMLDYRARK